MSEVFITAIFAACLLGECTSMLIGLPQVGVWKMKTKTLFLILGKKTSSGYLLANSNHGDFRLIVATNRGQRALSCKN